MLQAEDKNSFDMGSGGPLYHPQFFVCKSEDFLFSETLITPPTADTNIWLAPVLKVSTHFVIHQVNYLGTIL